MSQIELDAQGQRQCSFPGCSERFVPPTVRTRFCPGHRDRAVTRHAAHNERIRAAHNRTCVICGKPFIATNARQRRCTGCVTVDEIVSAGSDGLPVVRTRKVTPSGRIQREQPPAFIGVDGEGTGNGKNHRYVLLGTGSEQREWPDGVREITEIFSFLYDRFTANPDASFVGFYLGYDFNMWLRLLPRERAWRLLTKAGKQSRARKSKLGKRLGPFPVEYQGWEFDMLAGKRFKLRPASGKPWMYICDAGPFFQSSFLTAIDPGSWPEGHSVVTAEEYELIKHGKERRDSAGLDDDMRYYNRLENEVLSRLMSKYAEGLSHARVRLSKKQWFGPGQAAQKWMRGIGTLEKTTAAVRKLDARKLEKVTAYEGSDVKTARTFYDAVVASYYGGWFEIPLHGHVPGVTYEYDINSAYPFTASRLPCLCGTWAKGTGTPPAALTHKWLTGNPKTQRDRKLRLCHIIASGNDKWLGPLPYRAKDGKILRPLRVFGWYWQHEIDAAQKAGLIKDITYCEWLEYTPCKHEPPLKQLAGLYQSRLRIGKNTPEGKAFKLVYNSVYGKFAQSLGEPAYGNPAYASLITSTCRTMILEAIATHPDRSAAVAMVATDGVFFLSPHPELDTKASQNLGEWSRAEKKNLTLFKPGVYWDDRTRQAISDGHAPRFKSRGINAEDFSKSINRVDKEFNAWGTQPPGRASWPSVTFRSRFTQTTVLQALEWTEKVSDKGEWGAKYRNLAGQVQEGKKLTQDSDPSFKRDISHMEYDPRQRVFRSKPYPGGPDNPESTPYAKRFGMEDETGGWQSYVTPDGPSLLGFRQVLGV